MYCVSGVKYRKFDNPEIHYIFEQALVLSIICGK